MGGETICSALESACTHKTEFGGCEIEIAEGVVIWTPATHLVGLPHQGLPYRSGTCPHLPRSFET